MSKLSSIYSALDGMSVTYSGKTPVVYAPGELKVSFETADLPARLLMPLEVGTAGAMMGYIDADDNQEIEWTVSDMLLIKPIGQDTLSANSAAVVAYIDAYATALKSNRAVDSLTTVVGWNVNATVREYPMGAERWYYAVIFTIRYREIN